MSSSTQTGMQQKAGTNFDGPAPVDAVTPAATPFRFGFASLAQKLSESGSGMAESTKKSSAAATAAALTQTQAPTRIEMAPTAVTTLPDSPNLSIVILDSGSLISSGSVQLHGTSAGFELLARIYRENDAKTRFVTIQSVLNEIKDEKTRQMMETLPFKIEVLSVDPEAIKECYRFATLTGDAKTLSATDIQIIALTYQLEKQYNGHNFIKTEPRRRQAMDTAAAAGPAADAAPSRAAAGPASASSTSSSSAPSDVPPAEAAEAASDAAAATHEELSEDEADDAPAPTAAPSESKDDDDDGEGAWITPSNIHKHQLPPPKSTEPESTIAVITTDYAMQNVLLQLGLRLLNIKGRSIKSIRNWQKKCHACNALSTDMAREFCAECGGHTMIRVNVTVNKAGLVRYWHGSRHLNLRGTIYSIPMPRAGRHAQNLKLSEDVIDERIRKGGGLMGRADGGGKRDKTPSQLFDDGVEFGIGRVGPNTNQQQYGYGKKNINAHKGKRNRK